MTRLFSIMVSFCLWKFIEYQYYILNFQENQSQYKNMPLIQHSNCLHSQNFSKSHSSGSTQKQQCSQQKEQNLSKCNDEAQFLQTQESTTWKVKTENQKIIYYNQLRNQYIKMKAEPQKQAAIKQMAENGIKYSPNFSQRPIIHGISRFDLGDSLAIDLTIGYFRKQISILMINGESTTDQGNQIGSGSFANVFRIELKGKDYAIKQIKINMAEADDASKYVARGIYEYFLTFIASTLSIGPKVDNIFGYDMVLYSDAIEFPMQYCQPLRGQLTDSIKDDLFLQILTLHSVGIVHSDIKPDNIAYSEEKKKWILIDYGLARSINEDIGDKTLTQFIGTYSYCSKEMQWLFSKSQPEYIDLYDNDIQSIKKVLKEYQDQSTVQSFCPFRDNHQTTQLQDHNLQQKDRFIQKIIGFQFKYYSQIFNDQKMRQILKENPKMRNFLLFIWMQTSEKSNKENTKPTFNFTDEKYCQNPENKEQIFKCYLKHFPPHKILSRLKKMIETGLSKWTNSQMLKLKKNKDIYKQLTKTQYQLAREDFYMQCLMNFLDQTFKEFTESEQDKIIEIASKRLLKKQTISNFREINKHLLIRELEKHFKEFKAADNLKKILNFYVLLRDIYKITQLLEYIIIECLQYKEDVLQLLLLNSYLLVFVDYSQKIVIKDIFYTFTEIDLPRKILTEAQQKEQVQIFLSFIQGLYSIIQTESLLMIKNRYMSLQFLDYFKKKKFQRNFWQLLQVINIILGQKKNLQLPQNLVKVKQIELIKEMVQISAFLLQGQVSQAQKVVNSNKFFGFHLFTDKFIFKAIHNKQQQAQKVLKISISHVLQHENSLQYYHKLFKSTYQWHSIIPTSEIANNVLKEAIEGLLKNCREIIIFKDTLQIDKKQVCFNICALNTIFTIVDGQQVQKIRIEVKQAFEEMLRLIKNIETNSSEYIFDEEQVFSFITFAETIINYLAQDFSKLGSYLFDTYHKNNDQSFKNSIINIVPSVYLKLPKESPAELQLRSLIISHALKILTAKCQCSNNTRLCYIPFIAFHCFARSKMFNEIYKFFIFCCSQSKGEHCHPYSMQLAEAIEQFEPQQIQQLKSILISKIKLNYLVEKSELIVLIELIFRKSYRFLTEHQCRRFLILFFMCIGNKTCISLERRYLQKDLIKYWIHLRSDKITKRKKFVISRRMAKIKVGKNKSIAQKLLVSSICNLDNQIGYYFNKKLKKLQSNISLRNKAVETKKQNLISH